MSLRTRPRAAVRHALRVSGLLVILGGLFGMHGLDSHGVAGMGTVAHAAMTVPAHAAMSGHEAMTDTPRVAAPAVAVIGALVVEMTEVTGHRGMNMGATGMCMAVLVLSLLLLILHILVNGVPRMRWLVARSLPSPLVRGRDPDPPSLFRLSIQRC